MYSVHGTLYTNLSQSLEEADRKSIQSKPMLANTDGKEPAEAAEAEQETKQGDGQPQQPAE